MPVTWSPNEIFGHFQCSTQSSGHWLCEEIFEFGPFLWPWQLFKEGTRQKIFTDFEHPFQMTISQAWNGLFQKFQSLE